MSLKESYKIVGVVMVVLTALSLFPTFADYQIWLGGVAVVLGSLSFTFEKFSILFATYWMKIGKFFGAISSRILLSVIFFLVILPIAILKRVFSKETNATNWVDVVKEGNTNFTKPW